MREKNRQGRAALLMAAALGTLGLIAAAPGPAPSGKTVTTTVTAVAKKGPPPAISQRDVEVYVNRERVQVVDWRRGEKLLLAVVIDEALDTSVASQLNDIKEFINAQPKTTLVAVGYARNGTVQIAQDFTEDHGAAAKALRIPIGTPGAFGSPYLSLQDLLKRLPETKERRAIVFVSSGIDFFRGNFTPFSPDLDTAIERAQRENVTLYSIYSPAGAHLGRNFFIVSNAQSSLSRLAAETGGEAFYLGFGVPVTFKPYLDEIRDHLNNQYLLTFQPESGDKDRYERIHVSTELPNVEFLAPSHVFVPKGE